MKVHSHPLSSNMKLSMSIIYKRPSFVMKRPADPPMVIVFFLIPPLGILLQCLLKFHSSVLELEATF